jgi:hypothetical protein
MIRVELMVVFQFVKATVSSMRSSVGWFGVVGLCATLMACDGKPAAGTGVGAGGDGNGSGAGAGAGATGGSLGTGGGSGGAQNPGVGGSGDVFLPDDGNGGTQSCRASESCDDMECGPIADGCGSFIDCGGCVAPATCGGSGVPSHCGVPGADAPGTCTPATCDSLSVQCGQHGDGCGGVITCPSCTGDGEECVQGQCQQTASCTPLTCASYPEAGRCGRVSDGCSGILDCDFAECPSGQRCGAQTPGICGVVRCTPWTCEEALAGKPAGYCGFVSDGCAGELAGCATVCGTGYECGANVDSQYVEICAPTGSSGGCTPTAQNTACAGKCGVVSDGCTSTYTCPGCTGDQVCGVNNNPNVCGPAACVPTTCQAQLAECGQIDDGCGAYLECGNCTGSDSCAGGGVPFECGSPKCVPYTQPQACTAASANCGSQTDGCSGVLSCGTCTAGMTCGGGGTANQCGSSCTPLTCNAIHATCGPQGDGCGNQINCGTCGTGDVCQGTPSTCQPDLSCPNLCQHQATCTPGSETRISGKVYAPNGAQALYNALVYIPNIADLDDLPALGAGVDTSAAECERCEDEDLGSPLVAALTGPDGAFTLNHVPSGVAFPLVVKMGKWRRVTMIPAVAPCSSNVLDTNDARLPRSMTDAAAPELIKHVNIPKMAVVSGKVDAIECVLRKIGVADTEFSVPSGNGRIHLYTGINGATRVRNPLNTAQTTATVAYTNLYSGASPAINRYDMAVLDCEGGEKAIHRDAGQRSPLYAYADAGGRVFASHYSYTYLDDHGPAAGGAVVGDFATTATWNGPYNGESNPTTGIIDVSSSKGQAFNAWLTNEGALHPTYGNGYINIIDPREYVVAPTSGITERFVYTKAGHIPPNGSTSVNVNNSVQQYSFGTPVGSNDEQVCGRVLYSAFHVAGTNLNTQGATFPDYCTTTLTAQEKILEFMIFDLSACVTPFLPPTCAPKTCMELGANCGFVSDGCGGIQNCGACVAPASCGGGGTANVCGSTCALRTCASAGATCGTIGDGCGGTLDCGTCTSGNTCGGGGTPNVCGAPTCTPRTCQQASATCGNIGDGCGGTLNCGTCVSPRFCGGGGPNTCGSTTCTPTGCGTANCGSVGDGCGNAVNCGSCAPGSACGAGGPNRCGPVCTPTTCNLAGKNCGSIGDGCGGVLNCGTCSEGTVCGGGNPGTPNVCGGSCTSVSCLSAGAACGTISDGCGGVKSCGTCPTGKVCGANGNPNQCGAGSCTPDSCGGLCGPQSDGCSGALECGPCNGCSPKVCVSHVDCGPVADGCGDLIDCGGCISGNTCGGGGLASKCGGAIH